VKFVPVIVTVGPDDNGPEVGDTAVTAGPSKYVYCDDSPVGLVPPAVVTVTSTVEPAVPAGAVAVTEVALFAVTVAVAVPNFTVALLRLLPAIVTLLPPAVGPPVGDKELITGGLM
jgi:hypothetical protein